MERIKTLVNIVTVAFGIGFCDGYFGLGFSDNFYATLGVVFIVALIWLHVDLRKIDKK